MTPTPHDALFKAAFSSPERAAEVLRGVLGPELSAQIDWTTLAVQSGSFIDDALQASHADLLYAATMHAVDIRIYLLLEHQSTPDRWMALRLLKYMLRIWDGCTGNDRGVAALPPILPVVLYHGDRAWTAVTEFSQLVALPTGAAALRAFTPKFRFALADLSTVDGETLRRQHGSAAVRLVLSAFKEARVASDLAQLVRDWGWLIRELVHEPDGGRAVQWLMRYLYEVRGREEFSKLDLAGLRLDKKDQANMQSIADMLREEGELKGMQRGVRQGVQQGEQAFFLRLLRRKFRDVPAPLLAQVDGAEPERLERWGERLLTADSIDQVFAD